MALRSRMWQQPAGRPYAANVQGYLPGLLQTSVTQVFYLGADALMALAYSSIPQLGLFAHLYPPPLLPKPGKDNARLQKLLKRTAKKKAATQASQSAAPFRSSLSPVNEASPDLEHSDHSSTPPRTPETPYSFYRHQPPRFSVKPVKSYQHVASPYPQRAAFGRGVGLSPLTVAPPLFTPPVLTSPSYPSTPPVTESAPQPPVPKITLPASSLLDPAAVEVQKPAFIALPATTRAPSPGFYSIDLPQKRPLTVLNPTLKSKSPQVATESPEVKQPKKDYQDGLKVVRKLFGKTPTAEKKALVETPATTKAEVKEETKKESKSTIKMAASESKSEKKEESVPPAQTENKEEDGALKAEPLLKALQKPKGLKSKMSGWSRLKKHMVVEQEEPRFPEMGSQNEPAVSDKSSEVKPPEVQTAAEPPVEGQATDRDSPKATKMWNAVLFQMFSTKENIMAQIEMNKSEEEKTQEKPEEPVEVPSFAHRLPVLLFSPRFDAKKLREAASRPVTKISTVFEMGLIGRKGKDEEPKDFNRTARGFTA
uniref:Uncharacterized protein n=1 Tax=Knipowitschia caucasica TaxID=637954 RepID=A0AAV2KV06_KNICA